MPPIVPCQGKDTPVHPGRGGAGCCAAAMKSATGVAGFPFLRTNPTWNEAGAGWSGMSVNRAPTKQAKLSGTNATPRPDSTAAIRLVALSCSSMAGGFFPNGAYREARNA